MWKYIGASVRGSSHEKTGLPCQDFHVCQVIYEYLVAVVADGAGSARHSETGSRVAAQAAADFLKERVRDADLSAETDALKALLTEAIMRAQEAVAQEARNLQAIPRDLATTLTLALAGPCYVASAQVGDGASIARDHSGAWTTLTFPPQTEYVNETTFITSPTALDTAQYSIERKKITGLALMTDGLLPVAVERPDFKPFARFLDPLLKHVADFPCNSDEGRLELEQLLTSPRIRQKTDDDLTLLMAGNVPSFSS